jgi:hypothetical protein
MEDKQPRNVNFDEWLKSRQSSQIEFWRDNGDNTCTRISDGLTLTYEEYEALPGRRELVPRRDSDRWFN